MQYLLCEAFVKLLCETSRRNGEQILEFFGKLRKGIDAAFLAVSAHHDQCFRAVLVLENGLCEQEEMVEHLCVSVPHFDQGRFDSVVVAFQMVLSSIEKILVRPRSFAVSDVNVENDSC